jgi:hypothetical protein
MAYINAEDCDRQEHAVILIGERESFQLWAWLEPQASVLTCVVLAMDKRPYPYSLEWVNLEC